MYKSVTLVNLGSRGSGVWGLGLLGVVLFVLLRQRGYLRCGALAFLMLSAPTPLREVFRRQ